MRMLQKGGHAPHVMVQKVPIHAAHEKSSKFLRQQASDLGVLLCKDSN